MTGSELSTWRDEGQSAVGRLATFFPDSAPIRVAVIVSRTEVGREESELTVIEFGTSSEALFACGLPLEFAERVQLRSADRSWQAEARVVAVQYHRGQAAVAARFVQQPACWVVKDG